MVSAELRDNLVKYMAACFELTRDGPTEQIQESVGYFLLDYHVLIFIFSLSLLLINRLTSQYVIF